MTHNLNSNIINNDGIIIISNSNNNNDSNSLEIYVQQQIELKQNQIDDLNRTSENNTSLDEKCNHEQKSSKKRKHRRGM
jgi:hypothetical protein